METETTQPQDNIEQALGEASSTESGEDLSNSKVAIFLVILALFGVGLWYATKGGDIIVESYESAEIAAIAEENIQLPQNPFESLILEAQAAFVFDINTGETLFAQNEEMQLPLASLTKLMTAYTASLYLEDDDIVIVDELSLAAEGDSGLFANESWEFKDLLDFTLIVSSNDGANTLASAAGVEIALKEKQPLTNNTFLREMNANARRIGLTQTYFLNETGLDPTVEYSGSYGSARDVALLMNHILQKKPGLLGATTYTETTFYSLDGFPHQATNTNEIIGNIPGLIASKTGFTDLAGGNLAVVFDAGIGSPIVVSVLGSTIEGRFSDVVRLVGAALIYIAQ